MKTGDVFYDYESTDFGLCGATFAPTEKPTKPIKNDGPTAAVASSSSGVGYRCVDKSLAERGYKISSDKCGLFDNCFNSQIKVSSIELWLARDDSSNYALINYFLRLAMTGFAMNLQAVLRLMSVLMMERLSQMRLRVRGYLLWRL